LSFEKNFFFKFQLVREKTKILETRLIDAQNQLSSTLQEITERFVVIIFSMPSFLATCAIKTDKLINTIQT